FMHDDVWINDQYFGDRVLLGLREFDIIGVAGNKCRAPSQPSWAFTDTKFQWNYQNLSGCVGHGPNAFGAVSYYGPTPMECELLDGVFLAANVSALREQAVAFDRRFDFHFYDLDFCRSARDKGLRLGTWPICLSHQSVGALGTEGWNRNYMTYLA